MIVSYFTHSGYFFHTIYCKGENIMCMNKENNNACCCVYTIIASLLAAVGIAGVFYAGLIASITTLIYFTLVLGVLGILYIVFSVFCGGKHSCKAILNSCLITTSIGSVVTSAFALALTSLATGSLTVGILIAAVSFFLISNLIALVNIIVSKSCHKCCD